MDIKGLPTTSAEKLEPLAEIVRRDEIDDIRNRTEEESTGRYAILHDFGDFLIRTVGNADNTTPGLPIGMPARTSPIIIDVLSGGFMRVVTVNKDKCDELQNGPTTFVTKVHAYDAIDTERPIDDATSKGLVNLGQQNANEPHIYGVEIAVEEWGLWKPSDPDYTEPTEMQTYYDERMQTVEQILRAIQDDGLNQELLLNDAELAKLGTFTQLYKPALS